MLADLAGHDHPPGHSVSCHSVAEAAKLCCLENSILSGSSQNTLLNSITDAVVMAAVVTVNIVKSASSRTLVLLQALHVLGNLIVGALEFILQPLVLCLHARAMLWLLPAL